MSRRNRYRDTYYKDDKDRFPVPEEPETEPKTVNGTITSASCVKVRESPNGMCVGFLNRGTNVLVDLGDCQEGYYKISSSQFPGWVYVKAEFCEVEL